MQAAGLMQTGALASLREQFSSTALPFSFFAALLGLKYPSLTIWLLNT